MNVDQQIMDLNVAMQTGRAAIHIYLENRDIDELIHLVGEVRESLEYVQQDLVQIKLASE